MRISFSFYFIILFIAFGCKGREANFSQVFMGTFEVNWNSKKASGKIELTNKTLQFQFPVPDEILISNVDFNINQNKPEVEWICALMMDKTVVRCSTEKRIFNTQRFFVDKGYYIVKFIFEKEILFTNPVNIEILINSNTGVQNISSSVNEVILN